MSPIFERKKCLTISKLNLRNKEFLEQFKRNGAIFQLLFLQVFKCSISIKQELWGRSQLLEYYE